MEQAEADRANICRIVVQSSRELSNEVAKKTGVVHQSPQVLLVSDGQCIWHESHRKITAETLKNALKKY